jgi:hypothetical protein
MNQTITPCAHGEPDAATSRKSGSAGGGEETTGRKAGTGASPPTQRGQAGRRAAVNCSCLVEAGVSFDWWVLRFRQPRTVVVTVGC